MRADSTSAPRMGQLRSPSELVKKACSQEQASRVVALEKSNHFSTRGRADAPTFLYGAYGACGDQVGRNSRPALAHTPRVALGKRAGAPHRLVWEPYTQALAARRRVQERKPEARC